MSVRLCVRLCSRLCVRLFSVCLFVCLFYVFVVVVVVVALLFLFSYNVMLSCFVLWVLRFCVFFVCACWCARFVVYVVVLFVWGGLLLVCVFVCVCFV